MRSCLKLACAALGLFISIPTIQAAESTPAPATQPSDLQAMQQQIQKLEAKVNELQTHQNDSQADMTAAVNAVLADADAHTAPVNFPTGYDPKVGFILQSTDGTFSIHPTAHSSNSAIPATSATTSPAGGGGAAGGVGDQSTSGFEIAQLRLALDGNLFSPLLTYYFQVGQDTGVADFGLLDAYVTYRLSAQSPLALKAGQFKDPIWHEKNLYPSNLMAVDRSLVDAFIGGGQTQRVQGEGILYDRENLRGQAVFHDGYNSANTPFFDAGGSGAIVGSGGGVTPTNWGASAELNTW